MKGKNGKPWTCFVNDSSVTVGLNSVLKFYLIGWSRSYDQRRPMGRPFRRPVSQPDTGYLRFNRGRNTQGPTARFGGFGQQSRTPIPQRGGRNLSGQRPGPRCNKCGRAAHTNLMYCPAINQICSYCGKFGHFRAVCRTADRD